MFKNHLEMIGRNETASKKARFWQSFVRSLKGSEDIRAEERYRPTRRSVFPELTSSYPYYKSIYDDPIAAAERITVPGYRYLPVHRETYGYSPRAIYTHNYPRSLDRYRPIYHVPRLSRRGVDPFDAHKAWQDHLDRLAAIDRLYPSRYGLYLKDRAYPITDLSAPMVDPLSTKSLKGIEYEPDNKPHWGSGAFPDRISDAFKNDPFFADADKWAGIDRSLRGKSPTPVKPRISPPRDCEVAYDADGAPLYNAGGLRRRPWADIFNPSPSLPISAITRDPFWYDWPDLKPVSRWDRSPSYVRDSYLSPVKRTYLWDKHPIRPLVWSCTMPCGSRQSRIGPPSFLPRCRKRRRRYTSANSTAHAENENSDRLLKPSPTRLPSVESMAKPLICPICPCPAVDELQPLLTEGPLTTNIL